MEQYGPYELLARLATGGMAHVFLARRSGEEDASRFVVIKRILPHLAENKEFVSMFLQEARVAARLDHPAIAHVLDLGHVDGSYFMAMEYVAGDDFRRVTRQAAAEGRTLPVALACRMVIGACEGLDFAHGKLDERGRPLHIVHRDVSPQNLLVTFDGQVKVIDFGIAKAADSAHHTRTGVLKGKYAYMSPEQAEGLPLDQRSDVFALGIVLFELITRTRLFKRHNDLATLKAVSECNVPRPTQFNPSIDPELEGIVLRALARERDERTPSAAQLARELEAYLAAHGLPGSTAHLRQFMLEIYAQRLATEKALGHPLCIDAASGRSAPTPLPPPSAPPPSSPPPAPRPRRPSIELAPMPVHVNRLSAPPLSASVASGEVSDLSMVSRRTRSRKALLVLATLLFLALAGAGSVLLLSPETLGRSGRSGRLATLDLRSDPPGAAVFLDGRATGRTTPVELSLEPGRPHELRLEREGYAALTHALPAFDTSLTRDVKLEKLSAVAPPVATKAPAEAVLPGKGRPVVPPAKKAGQGTVVAATRKGTLIVNTTPPGIALHVDGRRVGDTPVQLALAPGRHEVRFVNKEWSLDRREQVTLDSGGTRTLERDLTPRTVQFNVLPYAQVLLDSELFAQSPGRKQIAPGTYRFTYTNPELGIQRTKVLEVTPGAEPLKVQFVLTADEETAPP